MENNEPNNLPGHDPDSSLSRAYKNILDGTETESDIEDPLFQILFKAREEDQSLKDQIPVQGKESAWQAIEHSIQPASDDDDNNHRANINRMWPRKQWIRAAAAILLLVSASLLLIWQSGDSGPALVAEAGTSVETVELRDGSTVYLRPNSSLYELSGTETTHSYSLSGEALFEVESSPDRTFSVEAGSGRVVVTGTRFNLYDRNERTTVYLIEGAVRFETIDGSQAVTLSPGDAAELDANLQLSEMPAFNTDEITDWTRNRLTFREREAGSIFSELEFHFGIRIETPVEVEQETLGGSIQLNSAEQSLKDLGTVLGGSFEQVNEEVYRYRSD